MLLLTSNPRKYEPLTDVLAGLQIVLRRPDFPVPEVQSLDFRTVIAHKARAAAEALGGPCLVDDTGLLLDAYPGFPGPLTGSVIGALGAAGIERLLTGTSDRARMVCHIGCWAQERLWHWHGEVTGRLDPRRPLAKGPGPLTQWFVPDEGGGNDGFLHRRRALAALGSEIEDLRRLTEQATVVLQGSSLSNRQCVFCQEFHGLGRSIYDEILGHELPCRVVHRTPNFLVFPPLGEFIEGGLLLASREHHISMASLPDEYYAELESLVAETCDLLAERYGCLPLLFEHAPVAVGDKGTCCVDHAHLNVFPVRVDVHAQLSKFPHVEIDALLQLSSPRFRNEPYLFLQANEGRRFVYHAGIVPSQYVRRIITAELGMPERWHWREYLGVEELKRTHAALAGWRKPNASPR